MEVEEITFLFILVEFCGIITVDKRKVTMKRFYPLFFCLTSLVVVDAWAINPIRNSSSGRVMTAQRAGVVSKKQVSVNAPQTEKLSDVATTETVDDSAAVAEEVKTTEKDMREKERMACMANNIGVSNTFVWASRYSDTSNYATMVEDVEVPDNNVCFVKAALKSKDPKIDVSGVPAKYFEMGQVVTCGGWADYDSLKQQILDAKKKGRTLGTIASVVGAAGVGVGAMELFGNKLIGDKVEGQYNENLSDAQLLRSQLLTLQKEDVAKYNEFTGKLKELAEECGDDKENEYCKKYVELHDMMFPKNAK